MSVALLGIFTEIQYKELRKKSGNWQYLYYFTGLGLKDACKLYLNNNDSLNYEVVSAHGVSKPRKIEFKDIKLNLINEEQEFYLAYIDVYYKLYFIKFMIMNNQSVAHKININKLKLISKNVDPLEKIDSLYDEDTGVEYWVSDGKLQMRIN